MGKKTTKKLPAESSADILTPDEFHALKAQGAEFSAPHNTALSKGGCVDVFTATTGEVVAVVRYVAITDDIRAEIAPLLATARAVAESSQNA